MYPRPETQNSDRKITTPVTQNPTPQTRTFGKRLFQSAPPPKHETRNPELKTRKTNHETQNPKLETQEKRSVQNCAEGVQRHRFGATKGKLKRFSNNFDDH